MARNSFKKTHLLLTSIVVLMLAAACSPSRGIPRAEFDALVAFYESTNGDEWTDKRLWMSDAPPCEWYGVGCEGGHVVSLTMNWNKVSGPLPAELGDLSELQTLVLYYNNLSGPLPPELGELQELHTLILHHNFLEGGLPVEFGNMRSLVKLDLEDTDLSGPLPASLGQLSQLEMLNLRRNSFSGQLPAEIGQLVQLQGLLLSYNNFDEPVPSEWAALTNLKMFGLYGNPNITSIPIALEDLPRTGLEFLDPRAGY